MKNWQYEVARTRKTLLQKKREGVKEVIWKLDSQAKKDAVDDLGFRREPWLYEIRTRLFHNLKNKPSIIKEVHHSRKRGKLKIVRHLTAQELKILHKNGVSTRELEYKIRLV